METPLPLISEPQLTSKVTPGPDLYSFVTFETDCRGAHLEALQARGLRLESPACTDTVRLGAVGHPREIDWCTNHVVLIAVKSQQTLAALCELAEVAPPETPIVRLQNGIANEPAALRMFPNVQAVSVACPTSHLEPGVVQAWSTPVTGLLDIGCYPTGIDQVSEAVAADFRAATFSSFPVKDIRRWKNRKLLTNLQGSGHGVIFPAWSGAGFVLAGPEFLSWARPVFHYLDPEASMRSGTPAHRLKRSSSRP